jgi:hypothetical protein
MGLIALLLTLEEAHMKLSQALVILLPPPFSVASPP